MRNAKMTRQAWGIGAAACLMGLAGGCRQNPFATADSDFDRVVSVEKLRSGEAVELSEFVLRDEEGEAVAPKPLSVGNGRVVTLSVEDARSSALSHNLDLAVRRMDPSIVGTRTSEEEAAFEALFTLDGRWLEIDDAVASDLDSGERRFQSITPEVSVPLRTGGRASVRLPMARDRRDNEFAVLDPAYTSDLEFSLSHQLLRGAGRDANTAPLRLAALDRDVSEAQTTLEVIRQLAAVDRSYWRVYAARQTLTVRQEELELAQAQLDRAQRLFDNERTPEIEVIRAQAGVAERLDGILRAEAELLRRQRELKRIINMPGLGMDGEETIETEPPPPPLPFELDPDRLAATAVERRMEMVELELRLAQDATNVRLERNRALPLLSLDYTYRINGLGGSLNDSFDTLSDNEFETWELGLRAEIPIGNEAAESRVRRAVLTRIQRLRSKEARELAIRQEVYDAVDELRSAWQRLQAAQQSVILNTRSFEAEQRQFGVGRSTSNDVLDASARLAVARLEEVSALVDYQVAKVDLAFATGTLLGFARVEWTPDEPEDSERDGPAWPWGSGVAGG